MAGGAFAAANIAKARAVPAPLEVKSFAMLVETAAPVAAQASLVRMAPLQPAQLQEMQLQPMPVAQPAVASPEIRQRLRQARVGQVVTVRFEGNKARFIVADGSDPAQLGVVQAALAQAMAGAGSDEARARLGQLLAALERRMDQFGMVSNIN